MYNVLWFEDEDYKFQRFKEIAELKGFKLILVKVRQQGINELKLHPGKYDAILLDAEMPEQSENEKAGTSGIKNVIEVATELQIPLFVSTGQDYLKQNDLFPGIYKHVFVKGFKDKSAGLGGDDELFAAMTDELDQLEKSKIKRMYSDVVVGMEGLEVEDEAYNNFLLILSALHFPDSHIDFNAGSQYNSLRIVFENICKAFIRKGILPDAFIEEGRVNILESYRYLTGFEKMRPKHILFYHDGEILPRYIAEPLSPIIFILNAKSHSGTGKVALPQSRYKLFSDALLFCEIIVFAYDYIRQHPDIDQNKSEWMQTLN